MPTPEATLTPPASALNPLASAGGFSPLWLADDHCARWVNGQFVVADELELLG